MASLFHLLAKIQYPKTLFRITTTLTCSVSASLLTKSCKPSFQVRSVGTLAKADAGFKEMIADGQRKYYMIGGKGGVGKTSCAASLAVKFVSQGHPTVVVSTDPAHSLSDSFDQDLTGGKLVPVEGVDSPLLALEIDVNKAIKEFQEASQINGTSGVKNLMDEMGLGMLAGQLGDLNIGELLDTPPPGMDEAIAIFMVMQLVELQKYSMFSRIVFDTAPTGHTLRLLTLPDLMDSSIGKMIRMKQKLTSAASALKSAFGRQGEQLEDPSTKLEQIRERVAKVRELFQDPNSSEFVIVTIPTVMAVRESSRMCASLVKENVPVRRLIINQVLPPSAADCKFCAMRRKDQMRALEMIKNEPKLSNLRSIQAPLFDAEIRGVPALKFMGDVVWR